MEFYTSFSERRPIRLSEATRAFAYDSLYHHKYGLETKKEPCIELGNIAINDDNIIDIYDMSIERICKEAPIRICEGERISCAATYGDALDHRVPVRINDEMVFLGISHLTIGFEKVLTKGLREIQNEAVLSEERHTDPDKKRFLKSCINSIDSMELWIKRYLQALSKSSTYENNFKNLSKVPFEKADSFYEAVQSIWAVFAFCRLCGNWPGIGRIDLLLGDYLKKDLSLGILTLDEAREILAHFFIKGCEWVCGGDYGSGDAQHYQNIVIGGIDSEGNEVTNEVTYLVLDIIEELGISDFPTTVRIGKKTPDKLVRRVSEVMRYGNGVLAIYNEELIFKALLNQGYDQSVASSFANDGCWEVLIPGRTYFSYFPFDSLYLLQRKTLDSYSDKVNFDSFEELYNKYIKDLEEQVTYIHKDALNRQTNKSKNVYAWNESVPCSVISLFVDSCIEKGLSYTDGGPDFNVVSPHIGGLADVANSLYAIKKLVFDDKRITFSEFMKVLASNWENNESLRYHTANDYEYFGNDNDEVDSIVANIIDDFSRICEKLEPTAHFRFPAGVSTFGRQLSWAYDRYATPNGRKNGDVLANNMSPTPGTALNGATAIINSYCKADLTKTASGAALDLRLMPDDVMGEGGLNALFSLIKGFCELGGFFMQIDIADVEVLRKAQKDPDNYKALAVRVAGWSARFVTLSKEWQDMIIENIEKNGGE